MELDKTRERLDKALVVIRHLLPVIIVGIIFIVIFVILISNNNEYANWNEITGTLSIVDHVNQKAYVNYVVGTTKYTNVLLNVYSSSYTQGSSIKLLYNPNNPNEVVPADISSTNWIIGIIMLIVFIILLITAIVKLRKSFDKEKVKVNSNEVCTVNLGGDEVVNSVSEVPTLEDIAEAPRDFDSNTRENVNVYEFRAVGMSNNNFILKDGNGKNVMECKKSGTSINGKTFCFINYVKDTSENHKIGLTYIVNGVNKTKFDGELISEFLARKGIAVLPIRTGANFNYQVSRNGKPFANYSPIETDKINNELLLKLKNSTVETKNYYIDTKSNDIEILFLIGFFINKKAFFVG